MWLKLFGNILHADKWTVWIWALLNFCVTLMQLVLIGHSLEGTLTSELY